MWSRAWVQGLCGSTYSAPNSHTIIAMAASWNWKKSPQFGDPHQQWACDWWHAEMFWCGSVGVEPACQCRRHKRRRFHPWVGKIPWRRAWQAIPVFLPGESPWTEEPGGLQSMGSQRIGHIWSDLAACKFPNYQESLRSLPEACGMCKVQRMAPTHTSPIPADVAAATWTTAPLPAHLSPCLPAHVLTML